MKKSKKSKKTIVVILIILIVLFVLAVGFYKGGVCRFDFFKNVYKKINFKLDTDEVQIPRDALSFSVYDMDQGKYLYYEGGDQQPTVASLAKLFTIDYALGKVDLDDPVEVKQEVLNLVPEGSSLADLHPGEYTVKEIIQAMLVPSGNDAAYALAYEIGKQDLGEGHSAKEYIAYFMTGLDEYLEKEGYSKTELYDDPSGASLQAGSHLDDINRVALKLLKYDFVRECIGKPTFSIQTPQGRISWENTNKFLSKKSPYYNAGIKGMKTGTLGGSYSILALYEKNGKEYLITCLAALSDAGRYKAVQSAIDTVIN